MTTTRKPAPSFRSAVLALLCDHGGRCDGPKPLGKVSSDLAFVPCLGLAVAFHAAADHRTKASRADVAAESKRLADAGWTVLRLREKPLDSGDNDLPVEKNASHDTLMLTLGRYVARRHSTGALVVPASTLARIHDVIRPAPKPPKRSTWSPKPIEPPAWIAELDGRGVVLLDCDGTVYDAWSCCGIKGNKRTSNGCTHLRRDTLAIVTDLCEREDAVVVVLSWRSGEYGITVEWLKEAGIDAHAVLVPDSRSPLPPVKKRLDLWGQVAFKAEVAEALMAAGVRIVGSFDDAQEVCDMMRELGVPYVHQVPHLVTISDYEWTAGKLGAKRPANRRSGDYEWDHNVSQGRLFDRPRSSSAGPHGDWHWDDDMFVSDDSVTDPKAALQDETDFLDRLDDGDAVYGVDYTVDGKGNVVPLFEAALEHAGMHVVNSGASDDDLADEAAAFLAAHGMS